MPSYEDGVEQLTVTLANFAPDQSDTTVNLTGIPPVWKPFAIDQELTCGSATDVEVIAAVAGKKFEVIILHYSIHNPVDSATFVNMLSILQDSANAAVIPATELDLGYLTNLNATKLFGQLSENFGARAKWFMTATAGLALEVDISGGNGDEEVDITGYYREVN